ncbi:MAG: ComEC/Rec2 family competence protein [Fimbriimonadaceae bacterium]|nr:ComEC/Rec2 family competence protein [Fimbriimonadaceae bacterium]
MIREIERRPALLAFLAFLTGLATVWTPWWGFVVVALLLVLRPSVPRAVVATCFVIGVIWSPRPLLPTKVPPFLDQRARVVTVPWVTTVGESCVVDVAGGRYLLRMDAGDDVSYGDTLALRGLVERGGPTGRRDVLGVIEPVPGGLRRVSEGPAPFRWGRRWREDFRRVTDATMDPRAAALVQALCFNMRSRLDHRMDENLSRTGTAHVVSASGLHAVVFAVMLGWLLRVLPVPRVVQLVLLFVVLAIYAGAAGFRPPIVRAVTMVSIGYCAYLVKRQTDWLSALGASGLVYLLLDPWAFRDVGFRLSFVTVAGLALFAPFAVAPTGDPWTRAGNWVVRSVQTSAVAFLVSGPLIAYDFGIVSLISVVCNLLVVPIVSLLVPLSLAVHALGALFPSLASWGFANGVQNLAAAIAALVEGLGELPFAAVYVPPPPLALLLAFYAGLLLVWRPRVRMANDP